MTKKAFYDKLKEGHLPFFSIKFREKDMRFFDTHTHLNNEDLTENDVMELAKEIEESQVELVMDIGFDMESSKRAVNNSHKFPWCYSVVGVHPHDAKTMDEPCLTTLENMALNDDKVKAIGEIGLDFHYDLSPRDIQRKWFRQQIRLANRLKLPIVIHSREADMETLEILKEEGAFSPERKSFFPKRPCPKEITEYYEYDKQGEILKRKADFRGCFEDARVDIHCFSGSSQLAIEYVKLGATIGIDGPVTYKNNRKTVGVVSAIPIEFIMAETDAPYLTPVPFRGKKNKSPYIEYTLRKIAEIKDMPFEDVAETTFQNGVRFFNIWEDKK